MTAVASGLSAYRSERGSSSATRQTPYRLSQNADQHRCSERKAAIRAAAWGVGIALLRERGKVVTVHGRGSYVTPDT